MNCYLCGEPIRPNDKSNDHVIPKQFIKRNQPKVKGYDYAGTLPSHDRCNNKFGPETYSQKALILIRALYDEKCFKKISLINDSSKMIMALNSDCFPGFTEKDLYFFKFIDVRDEGRNKWACPDYFDNKKKTNPEKNALNIVLAVLSKSAAALLVSRYLNVIPTEWRIIAVSYVGVINFDLDEIFGETKPFEIGVKTWVRKIDINDWLVAYKVDDTLVYLYFWFSGKKSSYDLINELFEDSQQLLFEGNNIMSLINYCWKEI